MSVHQNHDYNGPPFDRLYTEILPGRSGVKAIVNIATLSKEVFDAFQTSSFSEQGTNEAQPSSRKARRHNAKRGRQVQDDQVNPRIGSVAALMTHSSPFAPATPCYRPFTGRCHGSNSKLDFAVELRADGWALAF